MIIHLFKKRNKKKAIAETNPYKQKKIYFTMKNYKNYVIQRPWSTEHFFSTVYEDPPGINRIQNTGFRSLRP
jgi:hypothetical protein